MKLSGGDLEYEPKQSQDCRQAFKADSLTIKEVGPVNQYQIKLSDKGGRKVHAFIPVERNTNVPFKNRQPFPNNNSHHLPII